MSVRIGANTGDTLATTTDGRMFGLGDRFVDGDGKAWVFVKATAAIAVNSVCTFDETYQTTVAPLTTSNDAYGDLVGVAAATFASGDYGWLQVSGPASILAKASCAANVRLNTTATSGSLDDDGTGGSMVVLGIALTTARAASDGVAPAILNFPQIGATL
jgi:hypothetical protein